MNRIDRMFSKLRKRGETALIPFITTGDPDIETTEALVLEMERQGADLIELGLPFSDPLADGPTIQAASNRALRGEINPEVMFNMVSRLRRKTEIPLVLMGYCNPLFQYGIDRFGRDAADAGIDGTIIPDLPVDEAAEWNRAARANGICNIFLVAPNTPDTRLKRIVKASKGFVYYVSVTGITGARTELPPELSDGLRHVREVTSKPVAVGFGISEPSQVKMLSSVADGIIVGSAIVRIIESHLIEDDKGFRAGEGTVERVGEFVRSLKDATRG